MEKNDNTAKRGCRLSYLLRHNKSHALEFGGWRSIDDLIHEEGFTHDELCDLVAKDVKNRYEINSDRTKIRALYGHSVPMNLDFKCSTPPSVLYHGTSKDADIAILDGLVPRARNYVHLSTSPDSAAQVGTRHGAPVIIRIDAGKMAEEGYEFYNPTGDVWLVREVPSRFFNHFSCPFLPNNQTGAEMECKMIKIVSDSDEAVAILKNDRIISSICEFEHLANTSFSLHTLGDWINRQIYIVVVTDEKNCRNELLSNLTDFQQSCSIILITPHIVKEIPDICADNVQDIHHILRSFCLLIQGGMPMHIDFNDVYTLLLKGGGEIKFLQNIVKTSSDIVIFWNDLTTLIREKNCDVIIHMALSEECEKPLNSICDEFTAGLQRIQNLSPEINCCYGCSYNQEIDSDNIYVSAFIRHGL